MKPKKLARWILPIVFPILLSPILRAQSFNASISGTVSDPTGAVVPGAELTLRSVATNAVATVTTGPTGLYSFPNLQRGAYELMVKAKGFRDYLQRGISVNQSETVRLDVTLELGAAVQTVEVSANASPLNFENAEVKQAITPDQVTALPLLAAGAKRSAVGFVPLMPGVNTGAGNAPFNSRINGGMQTGDEATLDGVTMQEGLLNQTGMVAFTDMPIAPEAVEEVSVLTSNYEPQYGLTTSGVISVVTKSGTSDFHGGAYEFHRNTVLNARSYGVANRSKDLENDYGAFIGGPAKVPKLLWTGNRKTYFFVHFGGFRAIGATTKPILSLPTMKMRQGDFSEWPFPIYDPATTRQLPDGSYTRDQFMGCDGHTPNVICPTDPRLANSLATQWLSKLPPPNRPGTLLNYEPAQGTPTSFFNADRWDIRVDHYIGSKDHIMVTEHYTKVPPLYQSSLPFVIESGSIRDRDHAHTPRINWDHTFSSTLLNHMGLGYLNWYTHLYNFSDCCVNQVPQIAGVFNHIHQPAIRLGEYQGLGGNDDFLTTRPTYALNDLVTWVKGRHTLKFGAEGRYFAYPQNVQRNGSGTFNFSRLSTGLLGQDSGNEIASFLLEQVDNANVDFRTALTWHPMGRSLAIYGGDTWKVTPKLSLNYGLRWDVVQPSVEKNDIFSFFDPTGVNPGAGGRLGRLAFAGTRWGDASFGRRHPEYTYYKAFAPRLGFAYSWNAKTVVRGGYGIFFTQAFYPGWEGGISTDGFNENVAFSSSLGGLQPAFILSQGFPQNFTPPPFISPSALNGQGLNAANNGGGDYRPFDANRLPYSQQWNLTIEHQFTENFYISTAYVGNKGTRLPSTELPLNALDPKYLSMGSKLFDQFTPNSGQTSLDGVSIPYPGWIEQMKACSPTVAQALVPYPQYCSGILGLNENVGNSIYHSFQLKAEKRFARGTSVLLAYTLSKLLTTSEDPQAFAQGVQNGVMSPFQRERNKSLAYDDVPQVLSVALIYQLPIGKGKRFLSQVGVLDKLVGGWEVTSIFRASSAIPFNFRNGQCNLPSQFRAACVPALVPGANPFAQDLSNFDPSKPLFNSAAFEATGILPGDVFNLGHGPRISNIRGFGFHNHDFGLTKDIPITERVHFEVRAEFFNIWNWHEFCGSGGSSSFNTDVSSASFGMWNGTITPPRNIQVGGKITF
jgi:hypothetical protein